MRIVQDMVVRAIEDCRTPPRSFVVTDEIYNFLFVRPAMWLGSFLWKRGDGSVIDGFLNGVAMGIVPWLTRFAGRVQSGFLFHYAFVMLIGVSLIVTWFAVGGGAH